MEIQYYQNFGYELAGEVVGGGEVFLYMCIYRSLFLINFKIRGTFKSGTDIFMYFKYKL